MKKSQTIQSTRPSLRTPEQPKFPALREFFARLPNVLYECGPGPTYPTTFVSDNVRPLMGYAPEDFYADPFFWTKRIHEHDRQSILDRLANIGVENAMTYEYRFRRIDGEYLWLHDEVSVLRDEHSEIVSLVGSWFDISQRKQLELFQIGQTQILDSLAKRKPREETLEQIVRLLESQNSEMVCSILRYDPATQTLHHGAAPSLPGEYNRAIDGASAGPRAGSCGTAAYRRSRVVVTDIQTDPLWADYLDLAAMIGKRACWSQPILSSSDQLLGTFAMYYREPRGPTKGEVQLIEQAASLAAIAIQRYHDEEMMRHTERLVSLGTLAAGIAHEINNPITGIQLSAECARNALNQGKTRQAQGLLDDITANTDRCARIVRGVLQFGRRIESQEQQVSLHQVVEAAYQLTRGYAMERQATVDVVFRDSDVQIPGRLAELDQVFVNLIRNAIESKDRGAHVNVQTAIDPDFVRVTVTDDGRGIPDELKARIFDPFFTTRQRSGGTGLGLSIVHGIVVGHGGTIRMDSEPGKGTTVCVCLPRTH